MPSRLYDDDLSFVHNKGYGFHWQSAAPAILKWLREADIDSGTVVDLGCGGGQWLARLAEEGYQPVGVDVSPAMIRTARKLAPSATLLQGSLADTALPACDAVTSLGEPLNYLDGRRSIQRTLKHVYRALRPGGLFIFDVRQPPTEPVETRVAARVGDDWACVAYIDEYVPTGNGQEGGSLVRRITTFRRHGASYRRSEEVHELRTFSKDQVLDWLRRLGFRARHFRGYGNYRLGPRQIVFVARK
jgi:SAM-dependent methyltransferase